MFLSFYYMLIYRVYRHRCRGIGPEASDRKWNPCNGTRPALGSCLCGKAVKCTIHDTDGQLKDNCNLQKCNWLDSLLFSRFTDKFTLFNCKFLWSQYLSSWNSEFFICADEDLQCCRQSVFWWRHAECLLLWSYWKVDPYPRARWLWRLLDNQETENDITVVFLVTRSAFFGCLKAVWYVWKY